MAPYILPTGGSMEGLLPSRDTLDGLKAWPCIFSLPGPQYPVEHLANIVSLIMEMSGADILQPPRCVQLRSETYFLAPIDAVYTLVLIFNTRKKLDDSQIRQFFRTVTPLLRTTDCLKKSLVGVRR